MSADQTVRAIGSGPRPAEAREAGEFEEVRIRRGARSGATMVVAVHRTVGGRSLGGCRMWHYDHPSLAVADAKRLARSMSFKAAAAGLALGGAKGVMALPGGAPPTGQRRERLLRDFADLVDSLEGRYISGQDVGVSLQDTTFLAGLTSHVAGRPESAGGCGDPSLYTARGVEAGIRASVAGRLAGCHVVIVGLGHVGADLARRLRAAGAQLTVTDIDSRRRVLADDLGAAWVQPSDALRVKADVLAPCALGRILDHDAVAELRVPVVAGAANNQLAGDDVAADLDSRGILWAPDFVINAGGLIAAASELGGFDRRRALDAVDDIAGTLDEVYAMAQTYGTTTLAAARDLAAGLSAVRPLAA